MQHPLDTFLASELNSLIQGIETTSSGKDLVEEINHFESLSHRPLFIKNSKKFEEIGKILQQFRFDWDRKKPLDQVIKGKNVAKYVSKFILSRWNINDIVQEEIIDFRKKSYTTICDLLTPNIPLLKPGERTFETKELVLNDFQRRMDRMLQKKSLKRKSESDSDPNNQLKKTKLKEDLKEVTTVNEVIFDGKHSKNQTKETISSKKKKKHHNCPLDELKRSISTRIKDFDLENFNKYLKIPMNYSWQGDNDGLASQRVQKNLDREKDEFDFEKSEIIRKSALALKNNNLKKNIIQQLSRELLLLAVKDCTLFREELKQIDLRNDDCSTLQSIFNPANNKRPEVNSEKEVANSVCVDDVASKLYQTVCITLQRDFKSVGGQERKHKKYSGRRKLKCLSKYANRSLRPSVNLKNSPKIQGRLNERKYSVQLSNQKYIRQSRRKSKIDKKKSQEAQRNIKVCSDSGSATTSSIMISSSSSVKANNSNCLLNSSSKNNLLNRESEKEDGEIEENNGYECEESSEFFTIFGQSSQCLELKDWLKNQKIVYFDLSKFSDSNQNVSLNIYIYLAENNCLENIPNLCKLRCSRKVKFLLFETVSDVIEDRCIEVMPNGGIVILDKSSTSFNLTQCQEMFNFFIKEKRGGKNWHVKLKNITNDESDIFDHYKKMGILSYEKSTQSSLNEFLINIQNETSFYNWYRRLILLSDFKTPEERSTLEDIGVECMEMKQFMDSVVKK